MLALTDTSLDRLDVLFAGKESLPRIDMFGFVKIAVRHVRQTFGANRVEHIVPVSDLPRVQQRDECFLIFPEVESVLAPFTFHDVRVRGDSQAALRMNLS